MAVIMVVEVYHRHGLKFERPRDQAERVRVGVVVGDGRVAGRLTGGGAGVWVA